MRRLAIAACVAGALVPAASALAMPSADPKTTRVEKAVKTSMQKTYKTTVPGLVFHRVSCTLAANLKSGRCKASFTYPAQHLNGVYQVAATIQQKTGGVRWRATSVSCTSSRTGKKVDC